jgi:hypothetical protein
MICQRLDFGLPNYQKVLKMQFLSKHVYNTLVTCHFLINKIRKNFKKKTNFFYLFKKRKEKKMGIRAPWGGGWPHNYFEIHFGVARKPPPRVGGWRAGRHLQG